MVSGNIQIKCKNCGNEFYFTESEQQFYSAKGFVNPKSCKKCRELKKTVFNKSKDLKQQARELSINDSQAVNKLKESLGK